MSNYKVRQTFDGISKILAFIIVVIFIVGIIGVGFLLFNRSNEGMYVSYDDAKISGDAPIVLFKNETEVFQIGNSNGWGDYSVEDCVVKVISCVDDAHDFRYYVEDDNVARQYSKTTDLTRAFTSDNEIKVAEDGSFELSFIHKDMASILRAGLEVESVFIADEDVYISDFAYFCITVTSPDGEQIIGIPFSCDYDLSKEKIVLDKSEVVF